MSPMFYNPYKVSEFERFTANLKKKALSQLSQWDETCVQLPVGQYWAIGDPIFQKLDVIEKNRLVLGIKNEVKAAVRANSTRIVFPQSPSCNPEGCSGVLNLCTLFS